MVKLAGSMLVSVRASRHRMELAANASIATAVSAIVLARLLRIGGMVFTDIRQMRVVQRCDFAAGGGKRLNL